MRQLISFVGILLLLLFPLVSYSNLLKKNENNFLVISDIHLNTLYSHKMEIAPSKQTVENDLDQATFKDLIDKIKENIKDGVIPKPRFIIFLGDLSGHKRYSLNNTLNNETTVFRMLKNSFSSIPIFYTFGNNDSLEKDYSSFKDNKSNNQYKSPYDVAKYNAGWRDGFLSTGMICNYKKRIFPCIVNENTEDGYYTAYVAPHFRLIALNSVLFSPNHTKTTDESAMNELQWLKKQLSFAKENQNSVLITMHIPPGNNVYNHSNFWISQYQTIFLNILQMYSHNIVGLLAAHTHQEELKIIKNPLNQNIAGIYYVAALSTAFGNSPSVKTFYFSQKDKQWQLSNYETFHFSIKNNQIAFNPLYSYQDYYCTDEENSLSQCLNNITADKMRKYFSAGNKNFAGIMKSSKDIVLAVPKE